MLCYLVIVAAVYLIVSSVNALIALIIGAEAIREALGRSFLFSNPRMAAGPALALFFLTPWIWLLFQVLLRVRSEAVVALVKIAENTSRQ